MGWVSRGKQDRTKKVINSDKRVSNLYQLEELKFQLEKQKATMYWVIFLFLVLVICSYLK